MSWAQHGDNSRDSQAALNRPWFESRLAPALASVPQVDAILQKAGVRIADIGCGAGWSTIALAARTHQQPVLGVDVDEPSIEAANDDAEAAGVADRARFASAAPGDPVEQVMYGYSTLICLPGFRRPGGLGAVSSDGQVLPLRPGG